VSNIHHVGHVVRDIGAAISLYRRMGFVVPPPSFPALPLRPGEPAHAFGAGNTHLSFNRSFVELVTVVDVHTTGDALADATPVPLQAPAEALDQLRESIAQTAARISTALARFEGLHILVFGTADVDATVARLEAEGVAHGAVNRVLRPGEGGTKQVSIGYVEIDSDSGRSPEGRLALAEDGPTDSPSLIGHSAHPNGAVQLVESVLCLPDVDLRGYERRYSSYLQRPA
jgi:catechol 2,3-dioxygenase-like lactoylglutathione lyase family enzyme